MGTEAPCNGAHTDETTSMQDVGTNTISITRAGLLILGPVMLARSNHNAGRVLVNDFQVSVHLISKDTEVKKENSIWPRWIMSRSARTQL